MRIASKPALLTVPVVMFITLIAVLALWATGNIGGSGVGGASTTASAVWNVEYWHKNAAGEVLQYQKVHNTVTTNGLDAAVERLIDAESGGELVAIVAGSAAEDFAFDNVVLLLNQTEDPDTQTVLGTSVLQDVDGANTGGDADEWNPADGVYQIGGRGANDGDGVVTVTFLAGSGNPGPALRMLLTTAALNDTNDVPSATTADDILIGEILAFININVDLADTDTLTITWTVDIS